jgi:uncharacterized membrane protein
MLKKIYEFCSKNGIVLMTVGFLMAAVSFLVYYQTRYYGSAIPQIAMGCTIAGFVIYVIGRFFVARARRQKRKSY